MERGFRGLFIYYPQVNKTERCMENKKKRQPVGCLLSYARDYF